MISSELRIGNYVSVDEYILTEVLGVSTNNVGLKINSTEFLSIELKEVKPIPLTEEWLLKFGFKLKYEYYEHNENYIEFWIVNGKIFCEYKGVSIYDNINYVHDLQNLHFAIYKRELKIK